MKNLIVTRADDGIKDMTDLTFPYLKKYADKCNSDFIVLSDCYGIHGHYRILQLHDLFDYYDRILCIDSDVLIMKDCPDIFESTKSSETEIITTFEDKGTRKFDRRNRLQKIQKKFGDLGIKEGYINTGFIVFHKSHQDIFKHGENTELYLDLGFDDVYLTYMAHKYGIKLHQIGEKYNFMSMYSEDWNDNASRFNAWIIHYAGGGFHRFIPRLEQMKQDEILLRKYGMLI